MNEETLDANDETVYTPELGVRSEVNPDPEVEALGKSEEAVDSADSSPDSEDNHDKKSGVQSRINKLTFEKYEQQRRADELEARLQSLELQKNEPPKTESVPLTPPALPNDVYDEQAMAQYHNDMAAYSRQVAEQAAKQTFEQQQAQQAQAQQQQAQQQVVSQYAQNAVRDGVDMDKLRAAETMLNQAGISDHLGQFIMNDPNGGKIVEYLGDNPSLAYELLALDPVTAGIKIVTELKPQVLSTTPRVTKAPEPVPDIRGGGISDKDDFERQFPGTEFI